MCELKSQIDVGSRYVEWAGQLPRGGWLMQRSFTGAGLDGAAPTVVQPRISPISVLVVLLHSGTKRSTGNLS